jgi:hypothetical protein
MKIKYRIRLYVPRKLWELLSFLTLKSFIDRFRFRERTSIKCSVRRIRPTFFIIRRKPPGAGFFSNVFFVLQGINRAKELGLVPVVDFKNYFMAEMQNPVKNQLSDNAWELFFEPLASEDLEEIYKRGRYIISSATKQGWGNHNPFLLSKSPDWLKSTQKLNLVAMLIEEHIKLAPTARDALLDSKAKLNWSSDRTLGVAIRGGNYVEHSYVGHARQLKSKELFYEVTKFIADSQIDWILPLTQEFKLYESLVQEFGEIVIKPPVFNSYDSLEEFEALGPKPHPNHWDKGSTFLSYEQNLQYLVNVYLISEAQYFIGSPNNAVAFALAKNNSRYSDVRLFSLGSYN